MDAAFYTPTRLSPEEAAEHDRVLGALTRAARALADAQLRTEVELDEAEALTAEIEALTERLLRGPRTARWAPSSARARARCATTATP